VKRVRAIAIRAIARMDEDIGIAEVIVVMKHPVVELAEGVEVRWFIHDSGQAVRAGYQIFCGYFPC
jgi:hypothetical protein